MVGWYKHDIPAWMDGTEALSDGAYRAYHVICQLIYLNEGAIALNEHGIAGRCRQSLRAFQRNLKELLDSGKLTLENGRLANFRARKELENVDNNRMNASKGGENSGKSRKSVDKTLKTNEVDEATLQEGRSLKTRLEETRQDDKETRPVARATRPNIESLFEEFWREYPKRGGDNPRKPAKAVFASAIKSGHDPSAVTAGAKAYAQRCATDRIVGTAYVAQAVTWLRQARWQDYGDETVSRETKDEDWDRAAMTYAKTTSHFWIGSGYAPGLAGCECPNEILRKYGIDPETGIVSVETRLDS